MAKIGIGRVSTKEQNPQRQLDAFLALGIDKRNIFIDKCTGNGGNLENRTEYQLAKRVAQKGDDVYLDALDRLGRNAKEIEQEWRYFTEEIGCYMIVLNMPILDTRPREDSTAVGDLVAEIVLKVFAWMAEQETQERKRRQRGGIEAAKRAGKYKGRKPIPVGDAFFAVTKQWVDGDITLSEAQKRLDMAPSTFFRKCKENGISFTGHFLLEDTLAAQGRNFGDVTSCYNDFDIPGLDVCGKTGTAQNKGKDHSAFLGFAPRNNPQIAIAVYVENGGFGATYGVPIGALLMEKYINGTLSEDSEKRATEIQKKSIYYGKEER